MGIKNFLQSRRDDAELGRGLWRRAHDRFIRGVDRFHQVLERLAHTDMVELVVPAAEGTDVPSSPTGVYSDVHRALSKAGNSAALCAEALAMARCFGECTAHCQRQVTVERRVQTVVEHIQEAERLIARARDERHEPALAR